MKEALSKRFAKSRKLAALGKEDPLPPTCKASHWKQLELQCSATVFIPIDKTLFRGLSNVLRNATRTTHNPDLCLKFVRFMIRVTADSIMTNHTQYEINLESHARSNKVEHTRCGAKPRCSACHGNNEYKYMTTDYTEAWEWYNRNMFVMKKN